MEDIIFNSLEDLYNRLKPALINKKNELYSLGYKNINEMDIWNYLKVKKWVNACNLSLYQMVDDIINADGILLADFYKKDGDINGIV